MAKFPHREWLEVFNAKLNEDPHYAEIAKNWEGDMVFEINPAGNLDEAVAFYLDLWHGSCRGFEYFQGETEKKAAFTLQGLYTEYVRLLSGEIEPMQAMLTRKLNLRGNMAVLMRNIPVILDFVRCAREVTDSWV